MVSENTPVKDLPSHLKFSYKLYKAHGTIVIDFIKANGAKFNSPKDWDYAPYLVRERLKGKSPPENIRKSINMIIIHRTSMAREFENRRKAARKPLTSVDLAHLSFIDKIRNLQRCWFPEDARDGASNSQLSSKTGVPQSGPDATSERTQAASSNQPAQAGPSCEGKEGSRPSSSSSNEPKVGANPKVHTDEQDWRGAARAEDASGGVDEAALLDIDLDRPQLDVAEANSVFGSPAPGTFVFELNAIRKFAKRYHPYHPRPLWWTHEAGVDDMKGELRRCTLNRWPVTVVIEDCYGRHTLEPDEVFDFAHDTERQAYSDYDSTVTGKPIKFSGYDGSDKSILYGVVTLLSTIAPSDYAQLQHAKPEGSIIQTGDLDAEIFLEEHWWRLFNSDPPEARSYTLQIGFGEEGEASATITRTNSAEGLDCSTVEARTYVEMLHRRGDTVCYWYGPGKERVMSPADVARFLPEI